jgi:hypothetical protein
MVDLDRYRLIHELNEMKSRVADLEETIQLIFAMLNLGTASTAVARVFKQNLKNKEIHKDVDC